MLTTEQIALIEEHFDRCEFDHECDFCKSPEFGTYCRENFGETEFYICGKCAVKKAEEEEAENVALGRQISFFDGEFSMKMLYLSAILIAAHVPARKATPTALKNFPEFVRNLDRCELNATHIALECLHQAASLIQDERAIVVVAELGRLLEIVRDILWGDIKHAQLIDEPR